MKSLWDSAAGLLLITGFLLGVGLPLGKIASAAGVHAMVWSFIISLGAGGVLLCVLLARRQRFRMTAHRLRYFLIAAAISYALPNLVVFSIIPKVGAGYTGIMYTLSPVVTLAFSLLLGMQRPNALGMIGIAVGFAGAAMVAVTRGEAAQPADPVWVAFGLLIPVLLAAGNIYRTIDWPADTGPTELAVGSHLASAAMLLAGIVLLPGLSAFAPLADVPGATLAQVVAAAAMFAFYFRLQAVGGPVYLSQISYVAAAVALFAGTLFLGEHYRWETWLGAFIVVIGVAITTRAQRAVLREQAAS